MVKERNGFVELEEVYMSNGIRIVQMHYVRKSAICELIDFMDIRHVQNYIVVVGEDRIAVSEEDYFELKAILWGPEEEAEQ